METIYFTYPTPLELVVQLSQITINDIYQTKNNHTRDIITQQLISTKEDTLLNLSNCDYREIIDKIKLYYLEKQYKIIEVVLTKYDVMDPYVRDINRLNYGKKLLINISNNPLCYIESDTYEQTYGLILTLGNLNDIKNDNKLEYVNEAYIYGNLSIIMGLELPNLTSIRSTSIESNYNYLLNFTQISALRIDKSHRSLNPSQSNLLCDNYDSLVRALIHLESNLTTLNLNVVTTRTYQNQTLSLFDLFIQNTTITNLRYNVEILGYKTHLDDLYNERIMKKVNKLIQHNTTIVNLELDMPLTVCDKSILDSIKFNTSLSKITLMSIYGCPIRIDATSQTVNLEDDIINFIEHRQDNLPILDLDICGTSNDFKIGLIHKYYYMQNLCSFINDSFDNYTTNNQYITYYMNYLKYNEPLVNRSIITIQ